MPRRSHRTRVFFIVCARLSILVRHVEVPSYKKLIVEVEDPMATVTVLRQESGREALEVSHRCGESRTASSLALTRVCLSAETSTAAVQRS